MLAHIALSILIPRFPYVQLRKHVHHCFANERILRAYETSQPEVEYTVQHPTPWDKNKNGSLLLLYVPYATTVEGKPRSHLSTRTEREKHTRFARREPTRNIHTPFIAAREQSNSAADWDIRALP